MDARDRRILAVLLLAVVLSALSLVVPWWDVAGRSGGSAVPVAAKAGPFDMGTGLVDAVDALVVGCLSLVATLGLVVLLVRELRALQAGGSDHPDHPWWTLGIAAGMGVAVLWALSAWYRDVGAPGAEAGGFVGWWLAVGACAASLTAGLLMLGRDPGPESLNRRAA